MSKAIYLSLIDADWQVCLSLWSIFVTEQAYSFLYLLFTFCFYTFQTTRWSPTSLSLSTVDVCASHLFHRWQRRSIHSVRSLVGRRSILPFPMKMKTVAMVDWAIGQTEFQPPRLRIRFEDNSTAIIILFSDWSIEDVISTSSSLSESVELWDSEFESTRNDLRCSSSIGNKEKMQRSEERLFRLKSLFSSSLATICVFSCTLWRNSLIALYSLLFSRYRKMSLYRDL